MHSMTQSAISSVEVRDTRADRRLLTAHRITACAQGLALEHGLDGFTMDDLAEAAGVSRRTLFNYFPGKDDAVLGGPPQLDDRLMEAFSAGGPSGNLVDDIAEIVVTVLRESPDTPADVARGREVMTANPRLIAVAHQRLQECVESAMVHIETREGASFSRPRIDVAIALVLACCHLAVDRYLTGDTDADLADLFLESLGTARQLLT